MQEVEIVSRKCLIYNKVSSRIDFIKTYLFKIFLFFSSEKEEIILFVCVFYLHLHRNLPPLA